MKSLTLILLVFFLLIIPISFAEFNCQLTSNMKECNNILNSNIPEYQKDQLLSSLLYNSNNHPDHNFIFNYNKDIKADSNIENLTIVNYKYIKNAYLVILTVMPSILENYNRTLLGKAFTENTLYVSNSTYVLSEYNYTIVLPTDNNKCKTKYTIIENKANFNVLVNNQVQGSNKLQLIKIDKDSIIKDTLSINIIIKQENYKLINGKCKYSSTNYIKDQVNLEDNINVKYDSIKEPNINIKVLDYYHDTTKLQFNADNFSSFTINFNNSHYLEQRYIYSVYFTKKPLYIAFLKADKVDIKKSNIISGLNRTLFIKAFTENCTISSFNHFYSINKDCNLTLNKEVNEKVGVKKFNYDLFYFLRLIVLVFIIYLIYKIGRYYFVKWIEV